MSQFILITGKPGVGKTTIMKKILNNLKTNNIQCKGFYTEEKRNTNNVRIGFNVTTTEGVEGVLARIRYYSTVKILEDYINMFNSSSEMIIKPKTGSNFQVGKYVVHVNEFENLCLNLVNCEDDSKIILIDEIGKMELLSKKFETAIGSILKSSKNLRVIATIPLKNNHNCIKDINEHKNAKLFNVTNTNRENIFLEIMEDVRKKLI